MEGGYQWKNYRLLPLPEQSTQSVILLHLAIIVETVADLQVVGHTAKVALLQKK